MVGLLPPSSSVTTFRLVSEDALRIFLPVKVLPVKATFWILGWAAMAAPAVAPVRHGPSTICQKTIRWCRVPYPLTMLTTPGGNPASLIKSASRSALSGVISEGLRMTVLPVARAGPNFQDAMSYNVGVNLYVRYYDRKTYQREVPWDDASLGDN